MPNRFQSAMAKLRLPELSDTGADEPDVFEEMTLQEHLTELAGRVKKMVIASSSSRR